MVIVTWSLLIVTDPVIIIDSDNAGYIANTHNPKRISKNEQHRTKVYILYITKIYFPYIF